MKEEQLQINNIKTHLEMMLTPAICEHAVIGTHPVSGHSIDFQVFRLLSGYDDLLSEIQRLREALGKAQQDINWMLNNRQFLNGYVFDYIEQVLSDSKEEGEW